MRHETDEQRQQRVHNRCDALLQLLIDALAEDGADEAVGIFISQVHAFMAFLRTSGLTPTDSTMITSKLVSDAIGRVLSMEKKG